ncbi:hypothetical protein PAMP_004359 [Pampus punctatissimus]
MSLWLLLLGFAVTFTAAAGPGSCVGRCGEVFTRGQQCTCDLSCLQHNECCKDFQTVCSSVQSCQGRCGETFRRGRTCECDSQCISYGTCCHDYQLHCDAGVSVSQPGRLQPLRATAAGNQKSKKNKKTSSESEELYTGFSGPAGTGPRPSTLQDVAQALGQSLVEGGTEGPGAGLFADVDLCSDAPINGLTALSNGTILIFKGELFWSVDPVSRSIAQPQSITDTLGVPSPIDTVFTRCNCLGNTYIIKGDQYWRLNENMVVEPGFPKPLASEFPGLMGSITAALAVPATKNKPESVYFFKNGDIMQKFTFPSDSTPSCSTNSRSLQKRRLVRQAPGEVLLSGEIYLKVSLKGFPTPITSALSMPSPQKSDNYQLYVFSGPLFFKIQISGDLPALAKPYPSAVFAPLPILSPADGAAQYANPPQPPNSIKVWLQCSY